MYLCYQSDNSYMIVDCSTLSFEKLILNENSSKFEHFNQHKWSEPNTHMIWWRKKEKKISGSWMKKQAKPNVYYDHQLLWNQIFKRREGKITFGNRDTYTRYRSRFVEQFWHKTTYPKVASSRRSTIQYWTLLAKGHST